MQMRLEEFQLFWKLSSPIPLVKQLCLEQVTQNHVWVGFEYHQSRRLHRLPVQPVPVLCCPDKYVLYNSVLQFVPITSCPVTRHHWKEFNPLLLTPSLQIVTYIAEALSVVSSRG